MPEELRAAVVLFASLLDERQRRLFAGLEALKCGWGGDRRIAQLLGIDPSTVESSATSRSTGCGAQAAGVHRLHRSPAQRPEVNTPHPLRT